MAETGSGAGDPREVETVALPSAGIRLDLPRRWERIDPPGDLVLVARQPDAPWFRVNVTVALDRSGPPDSAAQAGELLAEGLAGGELVDAVDHPDGGWVVTVVHRAPAQDVVTTQRLIPLAEHTVGVAYTWAVEQEPEWREAVAPLLDSIVAG